MALLCLTASVVFRDRPEGLDMARHAGRLGRSAGGGADCRPSTKAALTSGSLARPRLPRRYPFPPPRLPVPTGLTSPAPMTRKRPHGGALRLAPASKE